MKRVGLFLLSGFIIVLHSMASISYSVSFPESKAHYAHIQIRFSAKSNESEFKVPVWTPGSYKVREFSQNMEAVQAHGTDGALSIERRDKNTWVVYSKIGDEVVLSYKVYCFVNSVRHSYVDERYAFLHGVSAFGYISGHEMEEIILEIKPQADWKDVAIAAQRQDKEGYIFRLDNYDLLADSPIALGNFDIIEYESGGVPHQVVMMGEGNYNRDIIKEDFKKISDVELELFGDNPCNLYVHFIQNTHTASGGLEHLNSQTSQMDRWGYNKPERYKKFLGLISHEYFHLWNVKRIRAEELGPFDYDKENYTDLLWVAEGITSYYDDLFLFRAGIYSEEEYYQVLNNQINRYENTAGNSAMNLEESSRLAWVKAYLPNENSHNTSISYYNKGMLVAWMLDLYLLKANNGKEGLDKVMQLLWQMYKDRPEKGFSKEEFIAICSQVAKEPMTDFFELLEDRGPLDYSVLADFGLEAEDLPAEPKAWAGLTTKFEDGHLIVSKIVSGSPAEKAGISVNDELIALDGYRLGQELEWQRDMQIGDQVELTLSRDGEIIQRSMVLGQNPLHNYKIKSLAESALRECWLKR